MKIIQGGPEHIDTIVAHRRAMFTDMGHSDEAAMDRMAERFRPWVLERMKAGEYIPWFVIGEDKEDGEIMAGGGLWLMDWPPHMVGSGERRGNIVNVYT